MRRFFVIIFSMFFFFLSTQNVLAYNFWDYFNTDYYNYNDYSYGYNYGDTNYDYGYDYNSYDYGYTYPCPNMSYFDYYSQICQCYEGYIWYDYECISQYQYCQNYLGPNSTYERSNNSCTCQSGYERQGQSCVYVSVSQNQHQQYDDSQRNNDQHRDSQPNPTSSYTDNRPLPTEYPPMARNTPIPLNSTDNRPLPTEYPPMARNTPIPLPPDHAPVTWPTPWPTITPRPIPSWLLEYNKKSVTPTPMPIQNTTCINPVDGKECTNINIGQSPDRGPIPTLIPANKPIQTTTISQDSPKTATASGFWQWVYSWMGSK